MNLFTNEGIKIKSVLDIPENCGYLIVSEKKQKFKDITQMEPPIDHNKINN
jgi:hypothetical protein